MSEIKNPGAAKKIGGFWDRLTGWFKKDAGEARTSEDAEEKNEAVVEPKE
jgi:hypothetical protein